MILYIYLSLSDLFHCNMITSRSFYVAANGSIPFIFMTEYYSILHMCVYTYIYTHTYIHTHTHTHTTFTSLFHSSVDGHLGGFHVLAIVNSAAKNLWVHIYF